MLPETLIQGVRDSPAQGYSYHATVYRAPRYGDTSNPGRRARFQPRSIQLLLRKNSELLAGSGTGFAPAGQ